MSWPVYAISALVLNTTKHLFTIANALSVAEGMGFGIVMCLACGFYPAWRAANLNPIDICCRCSRVFLCNSWRRVSQPRKPRRRCSGELNNLRPTSSAGNVYGLTSDTTEGIDQIRFTIGLVPGTPYIDMEKMHIIVTPGLRTKDTRMDQRKFINGRHELYRPEKWCRYLPANYVIRRPGGNPV